jgi:hypothetical protein
MIQLWVTVLVTCIGIVVTAINSRKAHQAAQCAERAAERAKDLRAEVQRAANEMSRRLQ